ncbi:MAG TPA: Hpt domain-containing protein [Bacteroidetes bacterium]|nr:Hpt domain-containing protein [Bacteroidota bacterium]
MNSGNQSGHDAGVVRVEEILDLDALLDRAGGDEEFLQELFDIFLEDSEILLDQIRKEMEAGDYENLARTAHKLKGSMSNFVSDGPALQAAKSVEQHGLNMEADQVAQAFDRLQSEYERLKTSIEIVKNR